MARVVNMPHAGYLPKIFFKIAGDHWTSTAQNNFLFLLVNMIENNRTYEKLPVFSSDQPAYENLYIKYSSVF